MLRELRIENLLLIERAELRLGDGLNAITGETGAGKTILAHALDLLMGGRAKPRIVRPGAGEAWVEGVFDLPAGLAEDPELAELPARLPENAEEVVLGRRVTAAGRTAAFVCGRSASAADLRLLGSRVLAFYGQHEHRRLTLSSAQLEVLDGFAGQRHLDLLAEYRRAHGEAVRIRGDLDELRERAGARDRDLDLLRYELSEIEAAAPDPEEESRLLTERERLRHAEALRLAAATGATAISDAEEDGGGAASALAAAEEALADHHGVDPGLDALAERVAGLGIELVDLGHELRRYLEGIEADPGRLEALEEQLTALERLKRKHGGSIESVLVHAEHCRLEIDRLENAEVRTAELETALAAAEGERERLGARLSKARRKAGRALEAETARELAGLGMEGGTLEVSLEPHADGFGPVGGETVELRLATNPGLDPAPLRDAASGGELSRVMLALSTLGSAGARSTVVFDEIDAGIGGQAARAVGERLRRLGEARQVLAITHLPQVASLAATHFRIVKEVGRGETRARVEQVDGEELVAEITRMLGADRSDRAADRHARELLAAAA